MTIHFVCRGNAFRSLIAEAYLRSLALNGITVISSGTVADEYKEFNRPNYQQTIDLLRRHGVARYAKTHYGDKLTADRLKGNDVVICLNEIVLDESKQQGLQLPADTRVWNVTDIGEKHRQVTATVGREAYLEEVYAEITAAVDELVKTLH